MIRRDFAPAAPGSPALTQIPASGRVRSIAKEKFRLKFAPHPGQFSAHAGADYLDQIRFASDLGFTAWEDKGVMGRPLELQEKASTLLEECGMTMGPFLGYASYHDALFAGSTAGSRRLLQERMVRISECAVRMKARWTVIIPGMQAKDIAREDQSANVVETLKMCADSLRECGVTMVLEACSPSTHGSAFLRSSRQSFDLCRVVSSPRCKISARIEEDLDEFYDELAAIIVSNAPGASPQVDHRTVFGHLYKKGFQGVIGMEHGNAGPGMDGEYNLIQAYRAADNSSF